MTLTFALTPPLPIQLSTHVRNAVTLLNKCVELTSKEHLAIANVADTTNNP